MATARGKVKANTAQDAFNELEQKKQINEVKTSKPFNFQDYQISQQPTSRIVKVGLTGDEFEVTTKELSWSRRNQILAKSLKWSADGQTNFDGDLYTRNCLKEMILDAPWGRTTEAFLLSIDERLGSALETIVPRAFGNDGESDGDVSDINLTNVDEIKKES